jgi:mannose-6-phosphate isomerase
MPDGSLYPLTFLPILKDRVWGGRRLHELYRKQLPPAIPVGESWEISDRVGDINIVANGAFAGRDLHWLIEHLGADLLNGAELQHGRFPLLIKILDASDKLSLQVHPPASKAHLLGGEPKTELWYIAEAQPGAELYVGLRHGCTREQFTQKLKDGSVADCFHRLSVKAGDAMFLPSGRVHALGAGMVIFEIQQNSDTTYRVFDWNRAGLDGKPRELHVNESLESIDFFDFEPTPLRPTALPGSKHVRSLLRDPLFSVDLAVLRTAEPLPLSSGIMRIVGVVRGELVVRYASGDLKLSAGQFCLIPAALAEVSLEGVGPQAECLCVRAGNGDL